MTGASDSSVTTNNGDLPFHRALLYASAEEFLATATTFVQQGLERGDAVLAITSDTNGDALRHALAVQADDVEFVDPADWYQVPAWTLGSFHRRAQRCARRGRRIRAMGEMVWDSLPDEQVAEWHRCEALLNIAVAGAPIEILCPYDTRVVAASIIDAAKATHPALGDGEHAETSARYADPLDFAGQHLRAWGPSAPSDAITMRFGAARIPAIRRAAHRWAEEEGLDADGVRDLLIAVHEVASNAVEHGGGQGRVTFWKADGLLVCDVSSSRPIPDPLAGYLPPDIKQQRGRGLWLARQICDRVDIRSGPDGATVRLWWQPHPDRPARTGYSRLGRPDAVARNAT